MVLLELACGAPASKVLERPGGGGGGGHCCSLASATASEYAVSSTTPATPGSYPTNQSLVSSLLPAAAVRDGPLVALIAACVDPEPVRRPGFGQVCVVGRYGVK